MKTIFEKVDPKFIKCQTGVCEHQQHQTNGFLLAMVVVLALVVFRGFTFKKQRKSV